jgi:hypothetical protein
MKKIDGFVKSPSVAVRFTPQFLRALNLELFTKPSIRANFLRNHHYFSVDSILYFTDSSGGVQYNLATCPDPVTLPK